MQNRKSFTHQSYVFKLISLILIYTKNEYFNININKI